MCLALVASKHGLSIAAMCDAVLRWRAQGRLPHHWQVLGTPLPTKTLLRIGATYT
jgi:hypothetical protein